MGPKPPKNLAPGLKFVGKPDSSQENIVENRKGRYATTYNEFIKAQDRNKNSIELQKFANLFAEKFGVPERVYYPASGYDAVPLSMFPKSYITFLEPDQVNIDVLKQGLSDEKRIVFVQSKAEEYNPEIEFDLVYISRSHAKWGSEIKDLKLGGLVILSQEWVDKAFDTAELQLVGVTHVSQDENGDVKDTVLVTNNLEKYGVKLREKSEPFKLKYSQKGGNFFIFKKVK